VEEQKQLQELELPELAPPDQPSQTLRPVLWPVFRQERRMDSRSLPAVAQKLPCRLGWHFVRVWERARSSYIR
jgi:hypothetical protein